LSAYSKVTDLKKEKIANLSLVSIVIPHFGSSEILYTCLDSLTQSTYSLIEIVIVDNGSDIQKSLLNEYGLAFQYIKNEKNLGFAGGCNVGIRAAKGKYIVLLNNDTKVDPVWLEPLINILESNPTVAACQPLLLSSRFEGKMDYAGALGGLIDIFGYPFAIGRIFNTIEDDENYYSGKFKIFWASGTASIWRKSILSEVGYLDEDFFAHMEEIDLNWRCQLVGYKILSTSESKVYHYSGYSLGHDSWKKMYLNHRNNLVMMLKNYEGKTLLRILPIRLILEIATIVSSICSLNWRRFFAVLFAKAYVLFHLKSIWTKRKQIHSKRKLADREIFKNMFQGSIIWHYFILRHKKVREFMDIQSLQFEEPNEK